MPSTNARSTDAESITDTTSRLREHAQLVADSWPPLSGRQLAALSQILNGVDTAPDLAAA